jgi:3-dehydroquinate dehydratase / shikimate dehydrogenase
MTQICVTLIEETTEAVIDRMVDLAAVADLFEIRGDMILDLDLLTILRSRTKPLVFTCRSAKEGGRWADSESKRRSVLLEAVKRGFDYVDVEYRAEFLDVIIEKSGNGLLLSYHDLEETPDDLGEIYSRMCAKGADIVKIAVTPRSIGDVGRLVELCRRAAEGNGKPLIGVALGPMGLITRIAAGRHGAPFTYASAAAGAEAAPGQVPAALMADLYRVRDVTPATRVYGILGSDVMRSLSPILHNRAFEARQIDAVYVPLQAEALEPFVAALPTLDLAGFSVTRPYKTEILKHLREVEETAALCGSVNTVVVRDGALRGSTTDGLGVTTPLKKLIDLKGKSVVILGAGGAARAAALALRGKGARVTILARDEAKAAAVGRSVGCAHAPLAELSSRAWDVLLNATPVGSASAPEETPVPAKLHRKGSIVFDMVYDPLETRLLREAKEAGCAIVGGLEMLLSQAVAQFETWTGLEAPVQVMKSAALFLAQEGQ